MAVAKPSELPPARRTPLEDDERRPARLSKREQALAEEVLRSEDVFVFVRTRTRVDVGEWFRRGRVHLCALAGHVALFAAGKRPYVERIPFRSLRESRYNHVTGELVLSPADDVRVRGLKMSPLDGYQVLAQIYHKDEDHA